MSALAGILTFDGAPVDPVWLASAGAALANRGADGGNEAIAGAVGMTYRAFHTTPESRRESQPSPRAGVGLLTWDGRLDNRDELRGCLGDRMRPNDTDVEYVWAAYERWGAAAFAKLIGDFALALWDARVRTLWLARDCVGTRTLYYHVDRRRMVWSSDLGMLLHTSGVPIEVNDEYIAGFLCRGPDVHLTPYVNIHAVRPGYAVIVRDGRVSEDCFWRLDPDREIHYSTDAEYEEHFRHLFREAVRVRLRSDWPVFAELSGGLDSSSIVCMANDIVKAGEAPTPRLETVSYVHDRASTADETRWMSAVLDHCGLHGHQVLESDHPILVPSPRPGDFATPNWKLASCAYDTRVRELMNESHSRVLLSGQGGDELLHSTHDPTPELSDLLAAGAISTLHRRVRGWSELLRMPYWTVLLRNAILPVLSERSSLIRYKMNAAKQPVWLNRVLVRKTSDMAAGSVAIRSRIQPGYRCQARAFASVVEFIAAGYRQEPGGVDVGYPMLHRPLVECLLAIPFEQKLRPREARSLQRRALRSLLPPQILTRRGKRNPSEAMFRALGRSSGLASRLLVDSRASASGYINKTAALRSLELAKAGVEAHSSGFFKLMILEMWLRETDRRIGATNESAAAKGEHTSLAVAPEGASSVAMRNATEW